MNNSRLTHQSQANIQVLDQIDDFFNKFQIGTLPDRCGIRKRHGYSVRFLTKATMLLAPMVKRILKAGVKARYVPMDSWFTKPANICALREHLDVIGMLSKTPKVCYEHDGRKRNWMEIYQNLTKRRGRAKILASTTVTLSDGKTATIVFVRDRRKKDWLALLSTDTDLADAEVVRIYGKRWDI